jgi:hypothetical protein
MSAGRISIATAATNKIPSGLHAVCFVSRNHELARPDFNVKFPVFSE